MGLERFELSTPRLSGVRSNHLSYWPLADDCRGQVLDPWKLDCMPGDVGLTSRFVPKHVLRKEVIQPQVPLRLPCYDFTPVTNHSLGACLPCGLA